jgi:hypothetical protein
MRPSTSKPKAAKRRVRGSQREGGGSRLGPSRDLASKSVGVWGAVLMGLLVVAFTAYGMIVRDQELLGKIWSLISGAVGAITAWLGLRRP